MPVAYSNSNRYLIYTNTFGNSGVTKLMVWDNQSKENREISGLNSNSSFIASNESNNFYVLSQSDKQTNIYQLNAETLEVVQLTDVGGITDFLLFGDLIYYTVSDENKIFLLRKNSEDEVLPVSSNGQAWVTFFGHQRFSQ
ncbi:MAG: hypothetical protein HC932_02360 [Thermales bacterium]|nr:hypothetical protein [Thermales bacterium]